MQSSQISRRDLRMLISLQEWMLSFKMPFCLSPLTEMETAYFNDKICNNIYYHFHSLLS